MAKYQNVKNEENPLNKKAVLYVVATPIGNLEDITMRAIRILNEVDYILCEDTRHTFKLLSHFNIKKKLYSCYQGNELKRIPHVLKQMIEYKKTYALVSDSGTPCISDPGYLLISELTRHQIPIIPIPGASAFLTLLSVSGFKSQFFQFYGFLSRKKSKRRQFMLSLKECFGVLIFYESPYRILNFLKDIQEIFHPQNNYVLGHELTKKFESISYGTVDNLANTMDKLVLKGEYTFLLENRKIEK